MITDEQKIEIGKLLADEAKQLNSWPRLANKLGVNQVTIRYNMQDRDKWANVSDKMWAAVAGKLNFPLTETKWHLVPTTNSTVMYELLNRAQNDTLFMAISHDAGQGKSTGVVMYRQKHQGVFYLECEESWSHKRFVQKLAESVGVKVEKQNVSDLTDDIVAYLKQQAATIRPLLVIDEANKLKPSSLRLFIPLFNKLQDEIGIVLVGAHDLKTAIQRGVRRDARGFDELESRLGRSYMSLVGILKQDVIDICNANGITSQEAHDRIWLRMQPERVSINGKYHYVAKQDLRVLKQAVKYERAAALSKLAPTTLEGQMGGVAVSTLAA